MQEPQAPVRAGDEVVQRFPARTSLRVGAWVMTGVGLVVLVTLAVAGVTTGLIWVVVVAVLLAACCGALAFAFFRGGSLAPVLTTTQLLSPGLFSGWRVVDLARVSGVGLRYFYPTNGNRSFWSLYVWPDDGPRLALQVGSDVFGSHGGWGAERSDEERRRNWQLLADTAMGRAALRIDQQVLALQGPDGSLARDRRETSGRQPGETDFGYWSPNGTMGRLR